MDGNQPSRTGWEDVPEGHRLNSEQQTERFLTFDWAQQVAFMQGRENMVQRANECARQNHFGAVYYAKHHHCQPARNSRERKARRRQLLNKGRKP